MNRRDRRARASSERNNPAPHPLDDPEYRAVILAMMTAFQEWRATYPSAEPPLFLAGPRELMLIAPLNEPFARNKLPVNESARAVVHLFCVAGIAVRGFVPTVMQLWCALELLELPVKRVSLGELGLTEGGVNN